MNTAVVGLGSNIEPRENIAKALQLLKKEFFVKKESSFFKTKPIGIKAQPDFLNGAVLLETDLNFEEFSSHLKGLEKQLGRREEFQKSGPRPIDLDILVWNNQVTDQDFYERDFVRQSVKEILPEVKS